MALLLFKSNLLPHYSALVTALSANVNCRFSDILMAMGLGAATVGFLPKLQAV